MATTFCAICSLAYPCRFAYAYKQIGNLSFPVTKFLPRSEQPPTPSISAQVASQNSAFVSCYGPGYTSVIPTWLPFPTTTRSPLREADVLDNQSVLLFHGYDCLAKPAAGPPLVDVPARSTTQDTSHIYLFHSPVTWFLYRSVPRVLHCQTGCSNHTFFPLGLLSLDDLLCLYCWADAHDSATLWRLCEPGEVHSKQYPTSHSGPLRSNYLCQIPFESCVRKRLDEVEGQNQSIRSRILSYKPLYGLLLQRFTRPDHIMLVRHSIRTLRRWWTHQHRTAKTFDQYQASRLTVLVEYGSKHTEYGSSSSCMPQGAAHMNIVHTQYTTVAIVIQLWTKIAMLALSCSNLL
jgi:hypothetical protein